MLKQVRDDIKSLINQIKKTDLCAQVAFNELCYGSRVVYRHLDLIFTKVETGTGMVLDSFGEEIIV